MAVAWLTAATYALVSPLTATRCRCGSPPQCMAARLMREVALVKDARKAEAERAAALRQKLSEALEARSQLEEQLARGQAEPVQASQAVLANRDFERQARNAWHVIGVT